MIDFHTDYTDFTESHIATLAAVGNLTKNASLHSRLPADKPAVVASDAHFASVAKPLRAAKGLPRGIGREKALIYKTFTHTPQPMPRGMRKSLYKVFTPENQGKWSYRHLMMTSSAPKPYSRNEAS